MNDSSSLRRESHNRALDAWENWAKDRQPINTEKGTKMQKAFDNGWTVSLDDDGTLDTLLEVTGPDGFTYPIRYHQDYACDYRDPETGEMTEDGFAKLADQAMDEAAFAHSVRVERSRSKGAV